MWRSIQHWQGELDRAIESEVLAARAFSEQVTYEALYRLHDAQNVLAAAANEVFVALMRHAGAEAAPTVCS